MSARKTWTNYVAYGEPEHTKARLELLQARMVSRAKATLEAIAQSWTADQDHRLDHDYHARMIAYSFKHHSKELMNYYLLKTRGDLP